MIQYFHENYPEKCEKIQIKYTGLCEIFRTFHAGLCENPLYSQTDKMIWAMDRLLKRFLADSRRIKIKCGGE